MDQIVIKSATIISVSDNLSGLDSIKFYNQSLCKIAVEALVPSELPKMLEAIRKVNKTYPLLKTKVEESGEHILLGTGELYLDNVLYDLR